MLSVADFAILFVLCIPFSFHLSPPLGNVSIACIPTYYSAAISCCVCKTVTVRIHIICESGTAGASCQRHIETSKYTATTIGSVVDGRFTARHRPLPIANVFDVYIVGTQIIKAQLCIYFYLIYVYSKCAVLCGVNIFLWLLLSAAHVLFFCLLLCCIHPFYIGPGIRLAIFI